MEHWYRGYQIETRREWSSWCVSVYLVRPNLPILPRSTLHTLTSQEADAVVEAKRNIDRLLASLDGTTHSCLASARDLGKEQHD
jgi:hypothetical protein